MCDERFRVMWYFGGKHRHFRVWSLNCCWVTKESELKSWNTTLAHASCEKCFTYDERETIRIILMFFDFLSSHFRLQWSLSLRFRRGTTKIVNELQNFQMRKSTDTHNVAENSPRASQNIHQNRIIICASFSSCLWRSSYFFHASSSLHHIYKLNACVYP